MPLSREDSRAVKVKYSCSHEGKIQSPSVADPAGVLLTQKEPVYMAHKCGRCSMEETIRTNQPFFAQSFRAFARNRV